MATIVGQIGDSRRSVMAIQSDGHGTRRVPSSMTLLFLPLYSPELMPMERVWGWMRQHDLSNRVYADAAAVDAAVAASWNKLTPDRLRSITATSWLTHEK